ncbi:MAG: DUF308 domain-containing protein [Chlamydiales bacterium]|nr:DUF308 domain-containing protein [Chlamydiales bacterium]
MNPNPFLDLVNRYKKLFIAEGIIFTLLGIFAMIVPQFFSLTVDYFLGWLFILGAIVYGIRTVQTPDMPNRTAAIVSTLLYLALGILLFVYPMSGILTLTLVLAGYFLFDGAAKLFSGWQIKPNKSWGWLVTSGIMSIFLGSLILCYWPQEAPWMLGMLVGINLFITGITTLGFIWSLSKLT